MKTTLLYKTPEYHKLAEACARVCYQSYDKISPTSHRMLSGILASGHLSVCSVGNMVFGIKFDEYDDESGVVLDSYSDLLRYKEINPFIRWTNYDRRYNKSNYDLVVSMNLLTFLNIWKSNQAARPCYTVYPSVIEQIVEQIIKHDDIAWFINDDIEPVESVNPYVEIPELNKPIMLTSDYSELKKIGLTDYELDKHSTATVSFVTDRASGLQSWRHKSYVGGCEKSLRYCEASNAKYRTPEDLSEEELSIYHECMSQSIENYAELKSKLVQTRGNLRSKEIARNVLPNVLTHIIQCRTKEGWDHFFDLRDTKHAQPEIRQDAKSFKTLFQNHGFVFK